MLLQISTSSVWKLFWLTFFNLFVFFLVNGIDWFASPIIAATFFGCRTEHFLSFFKTYFFDFGIASTWLPSSSSYFLAGTLSALLPFLNAKLTTLSSSLSNYLSSTSNTVFGILKVCFSSSLYLILLVSSSSSSSPSAKSRFISLSIDDE